MAEAPTNGTVKKAKATPPSRDEADILAKQTGNLLVVDRALDDIINGDVHMGLYESPFTHPLYSVRIKLDSIRGRKGRRVAAYARSVKPKKVKA